MILVQKRLKKIDELLVQKSINAAELRGDEYNKFLFEQMLGSNLSECDHRMCNIYLFGGEFFHKTVKELEELP